MTSKQTSQCRGTDGRFVSLKRSSTESGIEEASGGYRKRRKYLQRVLFESFISVFFIKGTEHDYVPFSSCSGPFVETYEKIVKSSYQLGRRNRSATLQDVYKAQLHNGLSNQIKRRFFKKVENPEKTTRPKIYMFRRLPSMEKYTSEILPLKEWLRKLEHSKALVGSFEEAYKLCCEAIASYKIVSDKRMYVGFNYSDNPHSSSLEENEDLSSEENRDPNVNRASGSGEARTLGEEVLDLVGYDVAHVTSPASSRGISIANVPESQCVESGPRTPALQSENERFLMHMNQFHDFARDETNYQVLCMMFDERLESKFHFVAGSFLEKNRKGGLEIPSFLKLILMHCHEKAFGTKKRNAHAKREQSLRSLKENVERFRKIVGLRSYEEISCSNRPRWLTI